MSETQSRGVQSGVSQILFDLGPILVFVIAFNVLNAIPSTKENAIYFATGLFVVVTVAAMAFSLLKTGRISPVLLLTSVIVTAFGGLTIYFHDPIFVQLKPTVVSLFYAVAIFGSLAVRQNIWKLLFGHAFNLPDRIWTILAVRWGLFFIAMALLNEAIRRTQSVEFWVNAKPFSAYLPLFLFALANTPLVMKHHRDEAEAAPPPETG